MTSHDFHGRPRVAELAARIPPGQHLVDTFPVLSAGPAPVVAQEDWTFDLKADDQLIQRWTWAEFASLPKTRVTRDIHCVTRWSKLDTDWEGVLIRDILAAAGVTAPTSFVVAESYDGYTTNVPFADLDGDKALIALQYQGRGLSRDHGGPARLLVPHLYFWKSAKWVNALRFTSADQPGFWEQRGYHIYGDPWKEQRYDER